MKKYYIPFFLLFSFAMFSYGVIVGKYEVFPYEVIKMVKNKAAPTDNSAKPNSNAANVYRLFQHFSPKADVAFIGDSITNGGRWSEFFPHLKVVNRGVGGDKASDIVSRLSSVLTTQPTKAFIMVGINDIHQYVAISDILDNYMTIVDSLTNANINVFIQSTIQCEISACGAMHVKSVNELNKELAKLALDRNVNFVDLGELSEQEGLNPKYTTDGVHLTAEGYIYWVNKLSATL